MLIGDLQGWPPVPADVEGDAPAVDVGVIVGSRFIPANLRVAAHVEVSILHEGKLFKAPYWHSSETILYSVAAALNLHIGRPLCESKGIELYSVK